MASAACASTKGNASPLATDASAPSGPSESAVAEPDQPEPAADVCVQYVVLRRDLWRDLGWPLGSVIAQVQRPKIPHANGIHLFYLFVGPKTRHQ